MAKPTPWKDEYTLLCEKCGYVVEGLDMAGPCPECGKPIAESLPFQRHGTPWQRRRSVFTLLRTWSSVLRHPKRTFDAMKCIEQDGMSLTATGLCFAVVSVFILMLVTLFFIAEAESIDILGIVFVIGAIYWVVAYVYAWFAAYRIEMWMRKKYRIDSHASWAIVGHASFGLCLPPIALILSMLLLQLMWAFDTIPLIGVDRVITLLANIAYISVLASFPVGLILFEFLCTIGVSRCKFRNRTAQAISDLVEPTQTDTRTT